MARIFPETGACLCDSGLYFCAYSCPDKLTQTAPPCLSWTPAGYQPVAGATAPDSGNKI